jgi:lipopolysaccharide export system protein LptA
MRTTQTNRYARWSATAAGILLVIVACVYLRRAWLAEQERKAAPPSIPEEIAARSSGFSFSKVEGDRTIFTVRSSSATQFKAGNRATLEDVWITFYGSDGARSDNLYTHDCDYVSTTNLMTCEANVEIDLESAAEAKLHPTAPNGAPSPQARVLHISTSGISFNGKTGVAHTDRAVSFRFQQGNGRSVGLDYDANDGVMNLLHDVQLEFLSDGTGKSRGGHMPQASQTPLVLTGNSLTFHRADLVARLTGAAQAQYGKQTLTAQEIALELNQDYTARRIAATGNPEMRETGANGSATLAADQLSASFTPDGLVGRAIADGNVRGARESGDEQDALLASHMEMEFFADARQPDVEGQPKLLSASGGVQGTSRARGATRGFQTSALNLTFIPAKGATPTHAGLLQTLAPASIQLTDPARNNGPAAEPALTTNMKGQTMTVRFNARNQMIELQAGGGVVVHQDSGDAPPRDSTSQSLDAHFDSAGQWFTVEQSGDVRYREGDRTAQAPRAVWDRVASSTTLMGGATISDAATRTTAQTAVFAQDSGKLNADGNVLTAEISGGNQRIGNFSSDPARISADHLMAERTTQRALYTGHARLWQGDALMQSDQIELDRQAQTAVATGHVQAVFPEADWNAAPGSAGSHPARHYATRGGSASQPGQTNRPELWRAQGGQLTYWSARSLARLEQDASAQSAQASISAPSMDFFFAPADPGKPSGGQQLVRSVASGGVTVRQEDRHGKSQRAEYTVADRKFVLSGGPPVLYDDSGNTTTGRQLTFIFADDRIVVDSEEGTRTLTLHRVEK